MSTLKVHCLRVAGQSMWWPEAMEVCALDYVLMCTAFVLLHAWKGHSADPQQHCAASTISTCDKSRTRLNGALLKHIDHMYIKIAKFLFAAGQNFVFFRFFLTAPQPWTQGTFRKGGSWSRDFTLLPRYWAIKQFIIVLFRSSWTGINSF